MKLEDLQSTLNTVENSLLSFLFTAIKNDFIENKDDLWVFSKSIDGDIKRRWTKLNNSLSEYIDDNIPKGALLNSNAHESLRNVDNAINLKISFLGKKDLAWKLVLDCSDRFLNLRNYLYDTAYWNNSIDKFIHDNKRKFKEFNEKHSGLNIFVSINYKDDKTESDELDLIEMILDRLENEYNVKFHYATEHSWFSNIFDNLQFYMISCHIGLAFFTKSNDKERDIEHNVSVAHELGFVQGLGKKSIIVKHKSISPFANIQGLLTDDYETTKDIDGILKKILKEYGICKQLS